MDNLTRIKLSLKLEKEVIDWVCRDGDSFTIGVLNLINRSYQEAMLNEYCECNQPNTDNKCN